MKTFNLKSYAIVINQFLILGYYSYSGPVFSGDVAMLILKLFGFALAAWAIKEMNPRRFSVFPDPRADIQLVTSGPYRWVRHPMYTSILLICGALTWERGDWMSIILMVILTINQIVKLNYEETLLSKTIEGYSDYILQSRRLLPFVW